MTLLAITEALYAKSKKVKVKTTVSRYFPADRCLSRVLSTGWGMALLFAIAPPAFAAKARGGKGRERGSLY